MAWTDFLQLASQLDAGAQSVRTLVKLPIPTTEARATKIWFPGVGADDYRAEAQEALTPARMDIQGKESPFKSRRRIGDTAEQINAYASDHGISLLVSACTAMVR